MLSTGAGILFFDNNFYYSFSVHNNTALHDVRNFQFYCLSNSTTTEYRPSIWFPSGRIYPSVTENEIEVSEYSTGIYVFSNNWYDQGIYICDIADSNGHIIYLSIGIYHYYYNNGEF